MSRHEPEVVATMPSRKTSAAELCCYRCGGSLASLSLPLARLDLCPHCGVELHVCRMCSHYAPGKPDACDEEDAVAVRDKQTANFCDYFEPDPTAFDGKDQRAENLARQALASLFEDDAPATSGDGQTPPDDDALKAALDLFRK